MTTVDLPTNSFKQAILAGRQQIGLWCSLASHTSIELLAGSGFDWLLLDTEHSPNELPMVLNQLHAVVGGTAHPIVRVPWNDAVLMKRYLDAGVQSFLVPMVQNADDARLAVAATRYPPRGVRGFASASRSSRFGRIKDYHVRCEAEICVLVQIETREAVDNLERIAAIDGVDGVFIGPGDLSADLGYLGQPTHPEEGGGRCRPADRPGGQGAGLPDQQRSPRTSGHRGRMRLHCRRIRLRPAGLELRGSGSSLQELSWRPIRRGYTAKSVWAVNI